jgi:signal transduction histidine kinase
LRGIFKLKGELVITALLALLISFLASFTLKANGLSIYSKDPNYRINSIYSKCVDGLVKELKSNDLSNSHELQQLLNNKYSFERGYSFYIADESGNIIAESNKGTQSLNKIILKESSREYFESTSNSDVYKIIGCDYLKNGYFLYFIYLGYGYDDQLVLLWSLIGFVILFIVLIWSRVSYISKIRGAVQIIAEGNLSHRVPLKYKNELKELAENINHMASNLEKEDKKRNEFLTNISHDLRTPLTTILGYINMIKKERYDSIDELAKYVNIMDRKGNLLKAMLDDFFEYSKLSSNDICLNLEKLELNELSRQLLDDEETRFKENTLDLSVVFSAEPVWIYGDSALLVRAFNNLLSNAFKYSQKNSQVQIKISKEKVNNINCATLSISNLPKDIISEEEVNSFFERLYKKDQSRQSEGSGLGLSIVKDIVKLHGGFIKALKENENLSFKIFIKNIN